MTSSLRQSRRVWLSLAAPALPCWLVLATGVGAGWVLSAALMLTLLSLAAGTTMLLRREHESLTRNRWLWFSMIALLLPALACCLLPPAARDELTHHLALPGLWLERGSVRPVSGVLVSYFPAWSQVLYAGALNLNSEALARLIHFFFGLLILVLPMALRASPGNDSLRVAPWLALLWLVTPAFHSLLGMAYADLPMLAALLGAWLCWARWSDECEGHWLVWASLLVGWALAIKYSALPAALVFVGATIAEWWRRGKELRPGALAPLGLILLLPAPHFLINLMETGNPIYPLAGSLFGTGAASGVGASHWQVRRDMFGESLLAQLLVPIRVFFSGLEGSQEHFDGVLSPLWLVLPPMVLWLRRRRLASTENSLIVQFLAVSALTVIFASARARYYLPALPPLAVLLLRTAPQVDWNRKTVQVVGLVCALGALFGAAHIATQFINTDASAYLSGRLTRREYLEKQVPEYGAIERGRNAWGADAQVYPVLTGNRFYYIPARVLLDNGFLPERLLRAAREADTPAGIAASLRAQGITHLLYPPQSLRRVAESQLESAAYVRMAGFFKNECDRIAEVPPFAVCALRGSE
ncbi:MAG: hypothetical protein KDH09_02870 [Chrysiogenetes bacterium]|nr:hypothetical protein [Chrysiogenetes bacterium]